MSPRVAIRDQQNLAGRKIALVVLTGTMKWSQVRLHLEHIAAVVNATTPGDGPHAGIGVPKQGRLSQMAKIGKSEQRRNTPNRWAGLNFHSVSQL
jgi:hypothetical protein